MGKTDQELKPVLDALEGLCEQEDTRIIFWHDPERQFSEFMAGRVLPLEVGSHSLTVVDLTPPRSDLGLKLRLEREDPKGMFLLYAPFEEPEFSDDWLLDIRLYAKPFRADRASIHLQELGLVSLDLREHLDLRRKFMDSKERVEKLRKLVEPGDHAVSLDLKMMAVTLKADLPEPFVLLRTLFHGYLEVAESGMPDLVVPPVARILAQGGASRWAEAEVTETNDTRFRQESRGHPGANTRYVKVERSRFSVAWKPNSAAIAYDARSDGMYPLITNCDDLPAEEVLLKYKYQPNLEKRHEQLKSVYAVAPAFLKDEGRIEALLLLYFLALLVQALIERQVRAAMTSAELDVLPLYPEDRECKAPTANRILEVFETIQRHDLMAGEKVYKCFEPKLTPLQEDLLKLLGVPRQRYGLVACGTGS